jgi:hypothetical protein
MAYAKRAHARGSKTCIARTLDLSGTAPGALCMSDWPFVVYYRPLPDRIIVIRVIRAISCVEDLSRGR